jgi:hypothetical protein
LFERFYLTRVNGKDWIEKDRCGQFMCIVVLAGGSLERIGRSCHGVAR